MLSIPVISSCSDNRKAAVKNTGNAKPHEETLKGCYVAVLKRDTFQLAITDVNAENIEGRLLLNFYEKDRSDGSIKGKYANGIVLADYSFQSEGVTSVRQVIFKKTARGFIEGYGNIKTEGGKEIFTDTSAIRYAESAEFLKTDTCLH